MHLRLRSLAPIALLLTAISLSAQELPRCSSNAHECELEIRQMLSGRRYLGAQIVDINPGVVIKSVNNDGPAARVGLQAGDRIVAINGQSMLKASSLDVKTALGHISQNGGLIFMILQRRGNYRKVEVRLQPYPQSQIDKIIAAHLAQMHSIASGGSQ